MQLELSDAIVAAIVPAYAAAYPTVPIIFDNAPFDLNSPPVEFMELEIKFYSGSQVGMAVQPKTRLRGYVYVTATVRSGTGVRRSRELLDWFANWFKYARIGMANFQEPEPDGTSDPTGWRKEHLKIGFYSDPT